jgi:hypothetical protein
MRRDSALGLVLTFAGAACGGSDALLGHGADSGTGPEAALGFEAQGDDGQGIDGTSVPDGGSPCLQDADCPSGQRCGFTFAGACSTVGLCVTPLNTGGCYDPRRALRMRRPVRRHLLRWARRVHRVHLTSREPRRSLPRHGWRCRQHPMWPRGTTVLRQQCVHRSSNGMWFQHLRQLRQPRKPLLRRKRLLNGLLRPWRLRSDGHHLLRSSGRWW